MRYILKMAFRNIGRNKRRTFLSAFAIGIAVMMVLIMRGYIGGIIDSMFDSIIKIETGHIKIVHPKYHEKSDMMPLEYVVDGFDGEGYKELLPVIQSVNGVNTVVPRIKLGVLLSFNGKSSPALGIGIDPEKEIKVLGFDKIMTDGKYLNPDENDRSIIIGKELASKLDIKVNDKLTIVTRTAYDSLRGMTFGVKGIFQYGITGMDSKIFYIPIGSASRLLEMGNGVSELVIMVDNPENTKKAVEEIKLKLQGNYVVIPWDDQSGYLGAMKSALPIYNIIFAALLILASSVIINTTIMVIYERIREIGTIGALGMRGNQITLLFTLEAAIVSAIGSFMGVLVGGGIDFYFSKVGINLRALSGGSMDIPTTDIIYPRFSLSLVLWSFIFGVAVATAVAYIPARRSARIEPVEALKSV